MTAPATEMPCREFVESVTAYLDGALPEVDRVRLEEHLAECPDCATYLEQLRVTLRVAGRIEPEHVSPTLRGGLLQAFAAWKSTAP